MGTAGRCHALFALLVALCSGCKEEGLAVGGKCQLSEHMELVGCIDDSTAARCVDLRLAAQPCRGLLGCKAAGPRGASCDDGLGRVGDPCVERSTPANAICAEDRSRKLVCREGKLAEGMLCRGPKGCNPAGLDAYPDSCDRTIARVFDSCREQSAVSLDNFGACSDDGKTVLECPGFRPDKFEVTRICSGPKGCTVEERIPMCDISVATLGDPCGKGDQDHLSCTPDGATVLRCDGGTWRSEGACGDGKRCKTGSGRVVLSQLCEPAER